MTPEQLKRLEEIKRRVYGRDCEKAYDKIHADRNWLIARLEVEAKENTELRKQIPDVVVTWGTGEKTGMNDPMRSRAESAERRAEALEAERASLCDAINTEARECHSPEAEQPTMHRMKNTVRLIVDKLRSERTALEAEYREERARRQMAETEVERLREALHRMDAQQPKALELLRKVGYVYNDTDDPMQKLVFSLYTYLVEISQWARAKLDNDDALAPQEPVKEEA